MRMPEEAWSYGLFIPHDPRAIGVVRATIRSILKAARLTCITDTAELLVSELATNAYRSATTDTFISMEWEPEPPDLRVAVWDTGPGLPEPRAARDGDESGRGLALVESCADDWGIDRYPNGKAVWFTMSAKPHPAE
ncbi:ATP-binding protein [Streptomyces sp. P1-3]|uniref:ATP-binding protein n=1 Tax=Streptomyces sp. P1-3 TaxID=3421658 RepID=UPI003D3641A6